MSDDIDNEVAEEVDDMPDSLKEGMDEEDDFSVDGEDVSKAEQMVGGSDVLEPVNDVELVITQVKLDKYTPEDSEEWKTARMELWLVIGKKGIDGKGKYAAAFLSEDWPVDRKAYDSR
jgi:hypothetical protein